MADKKPGNRKQQPEQEFADFVKELAQLVGKFLWDLIRLTGRGLLLAYRAIGRRRSQEIRSAEHHDRQGNSLLDNARTLLDRQLNREHQDSESQGAEPVPKKGVAAGDGYVDMNAAGDREAASALEDLLKETASQLQGQDNTETDIPVQAENAEAATGSAGTGVTETTTEETDPETAEASSPEEHARQIEEQLRQREAALLGGDQAGSSETTETPSYKSDPTEQAKIEEQLRQRQEILEQEKEQRKTAFDEKEAHRERLRQQVEADKARLEAERRRKQEAFEKAEAERKAREQERLETARRARLGDTEPDDDTAADDNDLNTSAANRNY